MFNAVFIIGNGYVGQRVAFAWSRQLPVVVSHRQVPAVASLANTRTIILDLDAATPSPALTTENALIYYFVPPPPQGQEDARLRNFLAMLSTTPTPARFVLISTTGVYGDNRGNWVDETTPPAPHFDRARRRLHGETLLQEWARTRDVPWTILRIPAIYGPGRLPEQSIRDAKPIVCREDAPWVNRIHVHDLVQFCMAAGTLAVQGIFNISDGHPQLMTDYFCKVADHLGLPHPPTLPLAQARAVMSPGMLSYLAESRRVSNRKALAEFGVVLKYPDLDSGLRACG